MVKNLLLGYEKDIVGRYLSGESSIKIAETYAVSSAAIRYLLKREGATRPRQKKEKIHSVKGNKSYILRGREKDIIDRYLSGESTIKIAEMYSVSSNAIGYLLKREGMSARNQTDATRKYTFDDHYFDKIDAPNKAYILGLIYADGCNYRNEKNSSYRLSIDLHHQDTELLEKIKQEIKYSGPLTDTNKKMKSLRMTNKHLSDVMVSHGITPKKSLTLQFPTTNVVPDNLISHFIRGYFDGDGCIYIDKCKSGHISIVSTMAFATECAHIINEQLGINLSIKSCPPHNGVTVNARFGGNKQVKTFREWLYKDADLYMERKKIKLYSIQ